MILLVDMDAFFASVEQAHHPHLRGQPVIVCGDPGRRGVVTAASYEARPFGVHAGMPLGEAIRLCPQAIRVEGNPDKYVAISVQLLDLYSRWTPDVEPFSVDEAFVGLPACTTLEAATVEARAIQTAIAGRFGIGASIGVGPNKLIAKMAAGVEKPRGITALDEESYRRVFWPKDVQELWGVGPKLAVRMRSLGFMTVGDLAHAPEAVLEAAFGVLGPQLREAAWGHDETPLVPYHQGVDAKSMGHEVTLEENSGEAPFLEGTLLRLADQVARRLRCDGYVGRTVAVKLRDGRFVTRIRQRVLPRFTADAGVIFESARTLWRENWRGEPLRLIGITVSSLGRAADAEQSELFGREGRAALLLAAVDGVRDRLGEATLVPLGSLAHRRRSRHVPFGMLGRGTGADHALRRARGSTNSGRAGPS